MSWRKVKELAVISQDSLHFDPFSAVLPSSADLMKNSHIVYKYAICDFYTDDYSRSIELMQKLFMAKINIYELCKSVTFTHVPSEKNLLFKNNARLFSQFKACIFNSFHFGIKHSV